MSVSLDHGLINEPHPRKLLMEEKRKYLCRKMIGPCLFIAINCVSVGGGYLFALYLNNNDSSNSL